MITPKMINAAHENAEKYKTDWVAAILNEMEAKTALALAEHLAIVAGLEGSNVAERNARMALDLQGEHMQLDAAALEVKASRLLYDTAKLELSRLRMIISLLDVEKK